MAECVIKIRDIPGDKVSIIAEPSFETMIAMEMSGSRLTSAHGYLFSALNHIRREAKKLAPIKLDIPRLKT